MGLFHELYIIIDYNPVIIYKMGIDPKWSSTKKVKFPLTFSLAYPDAIKEVIHRDNFMDYL